MGKTTNKEEDKVVEDVVDITPPHIDYDSGADVFDKVEALLETPPEEESIEEAPVEITEEATEVVEVEDVEDEVEVEDTTETPEVEASTEETEVEESEDPHETIARLRQIIASGGDTTTTPATTPEKKEEEEKEEAPLPLQGDPSEPIQFISTREEAIALLSDPNKLNELFNQVLSVAQQKTFSALPQIINTSVREQVSLTSKVKSFYEANPDLKPFEKYVQTVFVNEQSRYPELTFDDILEATAVRVRKDLALDKVAKETEVKRVKKAPFATGKKTSSSGGQKVSETQKAISELINI